MPWLAAAIASARVRIIFARTIGVAAAIGLGGAVSGCSTGGQNLASFAQASGGATLAFESIDGPPPQVFERLVNALSVESQGKPVAIVSRDTPAAYHIRSYLSAQVRRGRTVIAWVFDVYDRDQQRTLRLTGEEAGGKAGRDAWAAADDQLLRRIAQAGLNGLSTYFSGGEPVPAQEAPPAPGRGQAVASADDTGSGIGRGSSRSALGFSVR